MAYVLTVLLPLTLMVCVSAAVATALMLFQQRNFQYHRRPLPPHHYDLLKRNVEPLRYRSSDGYLQTSYTFAHQQLSNTLDVFVYLHGRSGLALDWMPLVQLMNQPGVAHLMIEYPSFANNQGACSQLNNLLAIHHAIIKMESERPNCLHRYHLVGHSLGCALALETARIMPNVISVSLLAPFYSGLEAGKRIVGRRVATWMQRYLWDTYDNVEHLHALHHCKPHMQVTILHGDDDAVVPYSDGQRLANIYPKWIRLHTYRTLDHHLALFCNDHTARILLQKSAIMQPTTTNLAPTNQRSQKMND